MKGGEVISGSFWLLCCFYTRLQHAMHSFLHILPYATSYYLYYNSGGGHSGFMWATDFGQIDRHLVAM